MMTTTSLSTRSSRGALVMRLRARWAAHWYTGYMPRIRGCSACALPFPNCTRARHAGTARSFGASSVRPLGSARRPMSIPSPRRRTRRTRKRLGIASGRRSLCARPRCSRFGRAWRRSCGGSSRRCAGFRTSRCGAARLCVGSGSTRRRMMVMMTIAILSRSVALGCFYSLRGAQIILPDLLGCRGRGRRRTTQGYARHLRSSSPSSGFHSPSKSGSGGGGGRRRSEHHPHIPPAPPRKPTLIRHGPEPRLPHQLPQHRRINDNNSNDTAAPARIRLSHPPTRARVPRTGTRRRGRSRTGFTRRRVRHCQPARPRPRKRRE